MPQETKVFESAMTNGVQYEIHEAQGFSDRAELAVKIEGEIAMVLIIEKKRSGSIQVKPSNAKTIRIRPPETPAEEGQAPPNVDDVLPGSSD